MKPQPTGRHPRWAPRSLRTQVASGMALLAIGVLAAMSLLMVLGAERLLRAELDRHLHRDIEAAMHALAWDGSRYTWRDTPHPEDDAFDTEPAVELWTQEPTPRRLHRREARGPGAAPQALPPELPAPAAAGYRTLSLPGGPWREAVEPRSVAGDSAPRWLRTLRSEAPLRAELAALALKIGVGALAAAALCALLAAAWVGRALAPLRALTIRMQRVNTRPDQLMGPVPPPPQGPDGRGALPGAALPARQAGHAAAEVAALAHEFDAMLARLAQSHQGLERFAADCAHALRTPLTALRLRGERQGLALPQGPAREAVAGMLEEADRMSVLIQRLLLLARAHDSAAVSPQVLDLGELLLEVFDTLAPLAEQRGMALVVEQVAEPAARGAVVARADAGWLRQVLPGLPAGDPAARREVVIERINALEEELAPR